MPSASVAEWSQESRNQQANKTAKPTRKTPDQIVQATTPAKTKPEIRHQRTLPRCNIQRYTSNIQHPTSMGTAVDFLLTSHANSSTPPTPTDTSAIHSSIRHHQTHTSRRTCVASIFLSAAKFCSRQDQSHTNTSECTRLANASGKSGLSSSAFR